MQHLQRGAAFVRTHYQTIIIIAVIAGLVSGIWNTTPGRLIQLTIQFACTVCGQESYVSAPHM